MPKYIIDFARQKNYDFVTFLLLDDGFISKQLKYHGIIKFPFDSYKLIIHNNKKKDIVSLFKKTRKIYLNFGDTDFM